MKVHVERWGAAEELICGVRNGQTVVSSLVEIGAVCEECGKPFEAGQYARSRYGPHGGANFHDDCTPHHENDEEEVECRLGTYCQAEGVKV